MSQLSNSDSFSSSSKADNYIKKVPIELEYLGKKETKELIVQITTEQNPSNNESLHLIQLKDENDFAFLYVYEIHESDFQNIKNKFNLLYSFNEFPESFIKNLDTIPTQKIASLQISNDGKTAEFTLVMKGEFRLYVDYKFEFCRPNDSDIIEYLKQQVGEWKKKDLFKESECEQQNADILELKEKNNALQKELDTKESEFRSQLSETKEQLTKESSDVVRKYEKQRAETAAEHKAEVNELQIKQMELEKANAELQSKLQISENAEKQLQIKLNSVSKDLAELQQQQGDASQEHKSLSTRFTELQSSHAALAERCSALQDQMKERDERIEELKEKYQLSKTKTQDKEGQLKEMKQRYNHLQSIYQANSKELKRGNEYILKYNKEREELCEEIKALNAKLEEEKKDKQEWKEKADEKDSRV